MPTTDYTNDDDNMLDLYRESYKVLRESYNSKIATGQDQFTPKLQARGNPNTRLSYASYFEEDDEQSDLEIGTQAIYQKTGEIVNIVNFDSKNKTATIELSDETKLHHVPASELDQAL